MRKYLLTFLIQRDVALRFMDLFVSFFLGEIRIELFIFKRSVEGKGYSLFGWKAVFSAPTRSRLAGRSAFCERRRSA